MEVYSNTTLVKVKFCFASTKVLFICNSNTTLVKVKLGNGTFTTSHYPIQIQHLLKLNAHMTMILMQILFKYNTC